MGLLDSIKQNTIKHPLKEDSFELRANYLKGVAFFLSIDESVDEKEMEGFLRLIDILKMQDAKDDLVDFLNAPVAEEFEETFYDLKKYKIIYLCDVLNISFKDEFSKEEEEFFEILKETLEISQKEIDGVINYFYALNGKTHNEIDKKLRNEIDEFMDIYGKNLSFLEALKRVKESGYALSSIDKKFRDNKEIVLEVVKKDGFALAFASNRLKDDKEVVLEAVKQDYGVLKLVSDRLRDDEEVVLEAVKEDTGILKLISDRLKDDEDIILEAVKTSSYALERVKDRSKYYSKKVALEAVKKNYRALEFISNKLRNDKDVALEAVKTSHNAMKLIGNQLKSKKNLY